MGLGVVLLPRIAGADPTPSGSSAATTPSGSSAATTPSAPTGGGGTAVAVGGGGGSSDTATTTAEPASQPATAAEATPRPITPRNLTPQDPCFSLFRTVNATVDLRDSVGRLFYQARDSQLETGNERMADLLERLIDQLDRQREKQYQEWVNCLQGLGSVPIPTEFEDVFGQRGPGTMDI
jgi:hypothetical protein